MCLPDGAHSSTEEFIYFHLPPVPQLEEYSGTTFGLACFRQIDATTLLNKTADVTRSMVQKAVVVLASQPILGSVRSKLALVTQAYFAQKDFSQLELLKSLYDNLNVSSGSVSLDHALYMAISLREIIYKFRSKVLVLLKALLLEKRVN